VVTARRDTLPYLRIAERVIAFFFKGILRIKKLTLIMRLTTTAATTATTSSQTTTAQWTCNTCHTSFHNSALQREHMRSQWHIYNLKRRVADLVAIDVATFEAEIQDKQAPTPLPAVHLSNDTQIQTISSDEDSYSGDHAGRCLFCSYHVPLPSDDQDERQAELYELVAHMYKTHGFFIPSPDEQTSLSSFLDYLQKLVFTYYTCVCCGTEKSSRSAAQQHMRARSHCMLNFEQEPELFDFWENGVVQATRDVDKETRLLKAEAATRAKNVRHVRMKAAAAERRAAIEHESHTQAQDSENLGEPAEIVESKNNASSGLNPGRQLARRTEQGLLGVTLHQRQSLLAVEKKAQFKEQIRVKAEAWSRERIGN
jgi:pre-60S factor REI1